MPEEPELTERLDGQNAVSQYCIFLDASSYIRFEGLDLYNTSKDGIANNFSPRRAKMLGEVYDGRVPPLDLKGWEAIGLKRNQLDPLMRATEEEFEKYVFRAVEEYNHPLTIDVGPVEEK